MCIRLRKYLRLIAAFLLVNFLIEIFMPAISLALTSGPASPEFSSFEPASTTDMVNVFSGDFVYNLPVINIPGPDGSSYPLSLSYHSGSNVEDESSWVGFGWTLNPGAINRMVSGLPDDYKDVDMIYYNKTNPNWTASVSRELGIEAYSVDIAYGRSIRFNNYVGFSKTENHNLNYMGVGLGMQNTDGENTFSASISPALFLNSLDEQFEEFGVVATLNQDKATITKTQTEFDDLAKRAKVNFLSQFTSTYGFYSFAEIYRPNPNTNYSGRSWNQSRSVQGNPFPVPVGGESGFVGNFNIQLNNAKETRKAYGYLYNINGIADGDQTNEVTDFSIEKNGKFEKRDVFLGIPFSNPDNYVLTGENLTGGFRAFHRNVGYYYSNASKGATDISDIGIEYGLGGTLQIGMDFGNFGTENSVVKMKNKWNDRCDDILNSYQFNATERPVFRFTNDLGGSVEYAGSTDAERAELENDDILQSAPGVKKFYPNTRTTSIYEFSTTNIGNSSSYIAYNTNEEYGEDLGGPLGYFDVTTTHKNMVYNDDEIANNIREISIWKEDGKQYVYGIPVYNRNELNVQVGVAGDIDGNAYIIEQNTSEDNIGEIAGNNKTIVGDYKPTPYANTYLLTQITNPDYFDVNREDTENPRPGPDDADIGGWTRFDYRKVYGDDGDWYNWRMPYSGLLYQKNTISDKDDDLAQVRRGEKEVFYLKAIETKTHYAFFITNKTVFDDFSEYSMPQNMMIYLKGSGHNRYDGMDANENPSASHSKGSKQLEYLERIVLVAKNRLYKPMQVVHFQYDYSLVKNTANNTYSTWPQYPQNPSPISNPMDPSDPKPYQPYVFSGKLTLKKVWFEYEGVHNARISPYEFFYYYFANYPTNDKYNYLNEYSLLDKTAQNPDYHPEELDVWGNHQYDGKGRHDIMNPWLYQGPLTMNDNYDPAAWQLKRIKLPSGGEIHIQYEEKDYQYVQDRRAMAMVSIESCSDRNYTLNLNDLGLVPEQYLTEEEYTADIQLIYDELSSTYLNSNSKRIFYKFLYGLKEGVQGNINDCRSEYITGYARLHGLNIVDVGTGYLDNDPSQPVTKKSIELVLGSQGGADRPYDRALLYARSRRNGYLDNDDCTSEFDEYKDNFETILTNYGSSSVDLDQFKQIGRNILKDKMKKINMIVPDRVGTINEPLSYIKVPMHKAKRGGGIRVKRLLMYDPGIEGDGDVNVYGNEYMYVDENGKSSGVATNEPGTAREENALIQYIERDKQSTLNRLLNGRDMKEIDGIVGENVLPSPSVGHSRVVIQNLHKGETGTGYQVNEYYTARDYPYDHFYQNAEINGVGFKKTSLSKKQDPMTIAIPKFSYTKRFEWATQGFRFIINNMHGQIKKTGSYGGVYTPGIQGYVTSSQEYFYYEPGERVKTISYKSGKIETEDTFPGKEMDVTMNMSSVEENSKDFGLEVDLSVVVSFPPPIMITMCPSFSMTQTALYTNTVTKVISYPAIMKKEKVFKDGAYHITEYMAFDKYTGRPSLVKNYDDFNGVVLPGEGAEPWQGAYYNLDVKASWVYPELGPKSLVSTNVNDLTASVGSINTFNECFLFEDPQSGSSTYLKKYVPVFKNIVSANLQSYKKNWDFSPVRDSYKVFSVKPEIEDVLMERWHPYQNYVYKDDVVTAHNSTGTGNNIYNSGYCVNSIDLANINWTSEPFSSNSKWLKTSEIALYSPNGVPLQESNALDIPSCVRYGYKEQLPVIIAQNARYNNVLFYDFEEPSDYPNIVVLEENQAHTGTKSLLLDGSYTLPSQVLIDPENSDCILKAWSKPNTKGKDLTGSLVATINGVTEYLRKIASSGEWSLYEADFDNWGSSLPTGLTDVTVTLQSGELALIDDIRFHPAEATATTFVYSNTDFRPVAQFDDQHFALLYQYNDEGKLVRKLVETERGVKTIQETQYNIKKYEPEY